MIIIGILLMLIGFILVVGTILDRGDNPPGAVFGGILFILGWVMAENAWKSLY